MANVRTPQRSFAGGEVTPELFGRIDDSKYQAGLARCRNFITKPQGPAENRAGFAFVHEVKDSTKRTKLIPFTFSSTQTMLIELGDGYFRFHTDGATLLAGSHPAYKPASAVTVSIPPAAATVTMTIASPCVVTKAAHGFTGNEPVVLTTTGALPTGLTAGTTYYVKFIDANTFNLSATPGGANINTSGSQSGTHTCTASAKITWVAHGLTAGMPVAFSTTGALPTGITAGTTYYVRNPQTDFFEIAATSGDAAVVTSGSQSGTHSGGYVYSVGEIAVSAGVSYYCTVSHFNQAPPNTSYWYALPATGEYEIPSPFAEADLFDVHYVQSADVLTLVHPNHAPRELRRLGATNWQLITINFAASISAPGTPTVTSAGFTTAKYTYRYVVTAVAADGISESAASAEGSVASNLFETGCTNTISWSAVTGAQRYNVYKMQGGVYGYIGRTASLSLVDANVAPDLSKTPPTYDTVFNATSDYPAAVSYFEQRRVFAGTINKPQNIWMTKSGTESNMSYGLPIKDDDRISFRVAAREANAIHHIVPLTQLLLLTADAEWRVSSINSDAITPTTISVRPQSYVGANKVQPCIVNNALIYAASRGGHVRELGYNWQAGGFITGDLSLRAPHLFDTYDISDMAYAKAPNPVVWFVSSSGLLLGMTYVPEQQIGAWHWHDTDGVFESCATVAEGGEDVLYCVIRRTINGSSKRYIERMHSRQFVDPADAFFVDCGLTYDGIPADVISGLGHLEGKTVSILADGAVHPQRVVTGGAITLDIEASVVQIGLPIQADMQTLPLVAQLQDGSFGQGHIKNVNKVWLRVYRSSGIFVGPSADKLVEAKQRTTEPYGSPPVLKSEEIEIVLTPSWADSGQIFLRQYDPLPLTVVSLTAEVALGG